MDKDLQVLVITLVELIEYSFVNLVSCLCSVFFYVSLVGSTWYSIIFFCLVIKSLTVT